MKKHLILSLIVASTLLCSCEQVLVPQDEAIGFLYIFVNNNYSSTHIAIGERNGGEIYSGFYSWEENPSREGYTFEGWSFIPNPSKNDRCARYISDIITYQQVDSVYAIWEEIPKNVKIRFQKQKDYLYVTWMGIYDQPTYYSNTKQLVSHFFGTDEGTSDYYEIEAGEWYPAYYYTYSSGEWKNISSYAFEGNKKYTFYTSDDGTYLTFHITKEGSWNAPQRLSVREDTVAVIKTQIPIY